MKYLKKFENFGQDNHPDLGRFSEEEKNMTQPDENDQNFYEEEEEIFNSEEDEDDEEEDSYEEERDEEKGRIWGDELVEKKKINAGFQAYLDKQKAKKEDKKEDKKETKKETTYNKSGLKHPEKADLDNNKKISGYEKVRGKAIQNAVQDEKEEKGSKDKKDDKGLSKAQMNLPEGLRKAIAAKKK